MKKSFKFILIITLLFTMFSNKVLAASATVGFSGNSTVAVGDTVTVKMYVSNVSDTTGGIVSVGGNLSFDNEYLQYVSATGTTDPYKFQINEGASYKIAGLDTTLESGISSQTTVFTFVFKALKEGTTQVTLTNAKLSDTASKITATVSPLTITIGGEQKSNDATLKNLSVDGYSLTPSFSANTTSYTIKVPNDVTTIKLNGTVNNSKATVSGLGNINLTGDITTATVKVTAEDGTTKTYNVKIEKETNTVQKSNDATLKNLSVDGYLLTPSFSSNTTSYTVKVPNDVTTIKLNGTVNNSKATVSGLGNINLTEDTTTATVKVKAEDGTIKTYTIKIEKETDNGEKSSDATLKSLDVSGFSLNPVFKSDINTYAINVANNITGLNVNAIPNNSKSTVTITGNKNWQEGINVILIKVTAEDGTVNNYTVNVNRQSSGSVVVNPLSNDNYLRQLIINSTHEINPKFNQNISSYNVTVPYEIEKLDLNLITNNSKAKVNVIGNESFKVGEINTVQIEVTAEDGTKRFYTLNVKRSEHESETDLKDIDIKGVDLNPKFDPDVLEYDVKVDPNTEKLDINAIPKNDGSKIEIIGNNNLKEGSNTVLIKVTDKNGFVKYYTLDVEKEANKNSGFSLLDFGIIAGIIGLLMILFFLLLLIFKRRKNEDEKPVAPIIEVKPEFNFSSKNSSDDDVVHGNLNQNSSLGEQPLHTKMIDADYEDNIPYDPYDDVVTKREVIDALNEAVKTKDPSKLKMLLEQDALNQKKKELKEKEELEKQQNNMDEWR